MDIEKKLISRREFLQIFCISVAGHKLREFKDLLGITDGGIIPLTWEENKNNQWVSNPTKVALFAQQVITDFIDKHHEPDRKNHLLPFFQTWVRNKRKEAETIVNPGYISRLDSLFIGTPQDSTKPSGLLRQMIFEFDRYGGQPVQCLTWAGLLCSLIHGKNTLGSSVANTHAKDLIPPFFDKMGTGIHDAGNGNYIERVYPDCSNMGKGDFFLFPSSKTLPYGHIGMVTGTNILMDGNRVFEISEANADLRGKPETYSTTSGSLLKHWEEMGSNINNIAILRPIHSTML